MARICVLGLNPAWQSVLRISGYQPGGINRASESQHLASGKGMNVARVLAKLGHEVTLVQVLAGENGKRILAACEKYGIRSVHVWAEGETRQCITLIDEDSHQVSEIIEPFAVDYGGKWDASLLRPLQEGSSFEACILSGTQPAGLPPDFLGKLFTQISAQFKLLDGFHGLLPADVLAAHAIKVNRDEWKRFLSGHPSASQSPWPLRLITDGAQASHLDFAVSEGRRGFLFEPPPLEGLVNPIGAGDTVTAGWVHYLLQGRTPQMAALTALAMGSASCLEFKPAHFDADKALALRDLFKVKEMP